MYNLPVYSRFFRNIILNRIYDLQPNYRHKMDLELQQIIYDLIQLAIAKYKQVICLIIF